MTSKQERKWYKREEAHAWKQDQVICLKAQRNLSNGQPSNRHNLAKTVLFTTLELEKESYRDSHTPT
uniref:Uncharacterized protein n=1 Tax=Setaria italica TaxID=4555 RepID=K4AHQ8_SETIT